MVRARFYSLLYVHEAEEICGRATGGQHQQFCMQATGRCSVLAHNTRRVSSRKRSPSCVQRTIYLKVTTVDSEVAVEPLQASYRVNENDITAVDQGGFLYQLSQDYVTALHNCSNDSEGISIFNTFVEDAKVRRRQQYGMENDARVFGNQGNGDMEGYDETESESDDQNEENDARYYVALDSGEIDY